MSIYSQLFKYRGRQDRSPLEDFLTEALADFLCRLDASNTIAFLTWLLGQKTSNSQWAASLPAQSLVWKTQVYVLGGIADLVLYSAGKPVIVVENKTWSPVREHGSDVEPSTQLATYAKWLSYERAETTPCAVVLLSATTPAPPGFLDRVGYPVDTTAVATWGGLSRWLHTFLAKQAKAEPVTRALAIDLIEFLKEHKLSNEILGPADIAATSVFLPSYDKIGGTLDLMWSTSDEIGSTFLNSRRSAVTIRPDFGMIWQWRLGQAKITPDTSWAGFAICFPDLKAQPWGAGLPDHPHYLLNLGKDRGVLPEPPKASLPEGWIFEEGELYLGKAIHDLPVDPGKHAEELTAWTRRALGEAKTLLTSSE